MITTQYICHNKCLKCGHAWFDIPRGAKTRCPMDCGGLYVKWLNYDATFGRHSASELGTWDEVYGGLGDAEIETLILEARKVHRVSQSSVSSYDTHTKS